MLNQPAFLIVASGLSTIGAWLGGRLEIGSCAKAERPGTASIIASASDRSARIVSPPATFSLRSVSARRDFPSIGISIYINSSDTNRTNPSVRHAEIDRCLPDPHAR